MWLPLTKCILPADGSWGGGRPYVLSKGKLNQTMKSVKGNHILQPHMLHNSGILSIHAIHLTCKATSIILRLLCKYFYDNTALMPFRPSMLLSCGCVYVPELLKYAQQSANRD